MELCPGWDVALGWALLPLTGLLFYIYSVWPYGQLHKLGLSGPPPELFFGNKRHLFAEGQRNAFKKWAAKYGRVYGLYMGRDPVIVTSDLDMVKTVLARDFAHFTDRYSFDASAASKLFKHSLAVVNGPDWKRIRSISSPTFTSGKLKQMESQISRCGQKLADNLLELARQGKRVDVKEYFGAFSLDVIASTAFGLQVNSQKDLKDPFLKHIKTLMSSVSRFRFFTLLLAVMPWMSPVVRWLRNQPFFSKSSAFFVDSIDAMIQQRKALDTSQSKSVDFLQLMINAEDTDNITGAKKRLTGEEIRSQMMTFFLAGYDTTSTTLQNVCFTLTSHPSHQQRLVQEIEQTLGQEEPTYNNVSKLKCMEHVIQETLRLYPPVTMVHRRASETVRVQGVTIPKGFGVLVPLGEVMRDPEYFPHPHFFRPDRFGEEGGVEPASFLPFGQGPRTCLGMRLAMLEVKVALVHVLRKVTFVRTDDLPETLQFRPGLGSLDVVSPPLSIQLEPRHL